MTARPGFTVVDDRPAETPTTDQARQATQLLMVALRALSERALVAIGNLFSLFLAASVWWLARGVLDAPSDRQLIGLGLYALFVLALHLVRRR